MKSHLLWHILGLLGISGWPWLVLGQTAMPSDTLDLLHVKATEGAAAGYVPDPTCNACHPVHFQGYQDVGMSRSFASPQKARLVEDFGKVFYHENSHRYYQITKKGDQLMFRRYMLDKNGKTINEFKIKVDWILGSANRARSYLYQTPWGELFQLPLGWYSENESWGMSPGFEDRFHPGINRQVKRECMFCHNGFPEVETGSDEKWQPHLFPKQLPQGTGCQRCHGPGADHIREALSASSLDVIRSKIVNPAKLPPQKRDSVCFQCHMLPAVNMVGSRRFNRPTYSFRPGQDLSDYILNQEVTMKPGTYDTDFEINHHGFRFWQSRCFQESRGKLACISCHNPHVKPPSKDFRAKVAEVCLSCHKSQRLEHRPELTNQKDCVTCHMPRRRTRDVVQVTMTDHRIARGPFDLEKLVKPIPKKAPVIIDTQLLPWGNVPGSEEAEIYRILGSVRALPQIASTQALQNALLNSQYPILSPYFDLLQANISLGQYANAKNIASFLLSKKPDHYLLLNLYGFLNLVQDHPHQARLALEKSFKNLPTPEAAFNLALLYFKEKDDVKAMNFLTKSLELRPVQPMAWVYKGRILMAEQKVEQALTAWKTALSIDPKNAIAYKELVPALEKAGRQQEAQAFLDVGLFATETPDVLKKLVSH